MSSWANIYLKARQEADAQGKLPGRVAFQLYDSDRGKEKRGALLCSWPWVGELRLDGFANLHPLVREHFCPDLHGELVKDAWSVHEGRLTQDAS